MGKYDDIINMPHHVSENRPHMSASDRAAQFLPFSALSGFEDAVEESGEDVKREAMQGRSKIEEIEERLRLIARNPDGAGTICVAYFTQAKKNGEGVYAAHTGTVRKADEARRTLVFSDGVSIPFKCIMDIQGDAFE